VKESLKVARESIIIDPTFAVASRTGPSTVAPFTTGFGTYDLKCIKEIADTGPMADVAHSVSILPDYGIALGTTYFK
jgi:hypothetical protein